MLTRRGMGSTSADKQQQPTTPPLVHHELKRRLSFVRSVSREQYEKSKTSNNLSDGASLLIVHDDEEEEEPAAASQFSGSLEDEVFHMDLAQNDQIPQKNCVNNQGEVANKAADIAIQMAQINLETPKVTSDKQS